jgi:hypothetical protein
MRLMPQDILFLLKLVTKGEKPWTYNSLAMELGMSPSELHYAAKRALASRLANKVGKDIRVHIRNLIEFLLHGIQYSFFPQRGGISRGMPTAHAAAPLKDKFIPTDEMPPVWPDPDGEVRGETFEPLHKSVPFAAKKDEKLYMLLALVDAIRGGSTIDREAARIELEQRLNQYGDHAKP